MRLDLNADVGESFGRWTFGHDTDLMAVVSSASIACGFHAGDPTTILATCRAATRSGVVIGAHVSYRDRAGFGRRFLDATTEDLAADILFQISALRGMARAAGSEVGYVKPHGALYSAAATYEPHARAVVDAVLAARDPDTGDTLALYGLPGSLGLRLAAEHGIRTVPEAFADRAYTPDGALLSRREPGAVLDDADEIAERVVRLATTGQVTAIDGTQIDISADTLCVHGDNEDAVAVSRRVRGALEEAGVDIRPVVPSPSQAGPTA